MKKKKLIIISSFLIMLLALAIFSGCKSVRSKVPDDYQEAGYYRVFLYFNGGRGTSSNAYSRYFIDKDGAMPIPGSREGKSLEVFEPTRAGYDFYGWYQIDDSLFKSRLQDRLKEGQPVYDKNNNKMQEAVYYIEGHDFLNTDSSVEEPQLTPADVEANDPIFVQRDEDGNVRQWNFDFDRVTQDTTIIALWRIKRQYVLLPLEHMYEDPDAEDFDRLGIRKYNCLYDGSIIELRRTDAGLPTNKGYQIEGFYLDTMFTTPVPFSGYRNRYYPAITSNDYLENGELKTIKIYIKWLSDVYTIVESIGDIPSRAVSGGREYYFESDGSYYFKSNINLNNNSFAGGNFRGRIEGNSYTIYNFKVDIQQNNPLDYEKDRNYSYKGIFDRIDGGEIRNINFEGITYNFYHIDLSRFKPISRKEYLNAFASSISDNSEIRNVNIGSTTRTDSPSFFQNIYQNVKSIDDYNARVINGVMYYVPIKYKNPIDRDDNERLPIFSTVNNFDTKGYESDGTPIGYSSTVIINSNINVEADPDGDVWQSPYEIMVNESNYRSLPRFADVSVLSFYGWCNENGELIDLSREWADGEEELHFAMWIR